MKPGVEQTGLESVNKMLKKVINEIGDYGMRAEIAIKAADIIAEKARQDAWAVRVTGNLARGIVSKKFKAFGPSQAFVAADYSIAPHAHLVEFGTKKTAANPIFRRAVRATKDQQKQASQSALDEAIKKMK